MKSLKEIKDRIEKLKLSDEEKNNVNSFYEELKTYTYEKIIEVYRQNQYKICTDLSFYTPLYIKSDFIELEANKRNINLEKHQISLTDIDNDF